MMKLHYRPVSWLLALTAITAVIWTCQSPDPEPAVQSVTRVDNLEVAGTTAAAGAITVGAAGSPTFRSGAGTPEGTITAPVGSLYLRTNGAALTTLYAKESGAGNTGWKPYANTDVFASAVNGLTPASGGGTTNFLRADGTWAVPPSSSTNGSIATVAATTWGGNINPTTEGTVDWAGWDAGTLNGTLGTAYTTRQMMPPSNSGRAGRLFDAPRCFCRGGGSCNTGTLCVSGTAGSGSSRSTTTGASNVANTANTNSLVGTMNTGVGANSGMAFVVPLFPGETGTIKIYGKLLDEAADWRCDLYQNGTSVDSDSGSWDSRPNVMFDTLLTITFTAGVGNVSQLVCKQTTTAIGGVNPRMWYFAATMF